MGRLQDKGHGLRSEKVFADTMMEKGGKNLRIAMFAIWIGAGIVVCMWAVIVLLPSFQCRKDQDKAIQPLMNEAEKLDISYEEVIASPVKYIGKPVVWCVQNRGPGKVFHRGSDAQPLASDGPIPDFKGDKHRSCQDMLLKIKGLKHNKNFSFTEGVKYINVE